MNKYSLSTSVGQQMVEVEDVLAHDDACAVAYASGRLDERHKHHGTALLRIGVCYRLDRQLNDDGLIDLRDETRIGDWFAVGEADRTSLLWAPHRTSPPG